MSLSVRDRVADVLSVALECARHPGRPYGWWLYYDCMTCLCSRRSTAPSGEQRAKPSRESVRHVAHSMHYAGRGQTREARRFDTVDQAAAAAASGDILLDCRDGMYLAVRYAEDERSGAFGTCHLIVPFNSRTEVRYVGSDYADLLTDFVALVNKGHWIFRLRCACTDDEQAWHGLTSEGMLVMTLTEWDAWSRRSLLAETALVRERRFADVSETERAFILRVVPLCLRHWSTDACPVIRRRNQIRGVVWAVLLGICAGAAFIRLAVGHF